MIEDAFDELTIRGEARIVPVFYVVALHFIASPIGALAVTARFVITAVRQEFVPDMAILGDPHSDLGMILVRHWFLRKDWS